MIELGRDVLNDVHQSTAREWLVTNGTGSYAAGTISGILTRRYHGLLVAALQAPLGRTVLVSKIDETARYGDQPYDLFSNQWNPDISSATPQGFVHLDSFALDGTTPVWLYSIGDALLEKRIWMAYGQNTTVVRYTLHRATLPLGLNLKILVNYKDFHTNVHAAHWQMQISPIPSGLEITAFPGAVPFTLHAIGPGQITAQHIWYRNYFFSQEFERGLDSSGDHLLAGIAQAQLQPGQSFTLLCTTEADPLLDISSAYRQKQEREHALIAQSRLSHAPDWIRQLLLAADQFIVQRSTANQGEGRTIIAGYPWFGDWGRDTMISLPGLTLATGREADAARILRTFADAVDQGMLPNRFPDHGEVPEYNTADATLWYFEAIRQYWVVTQDHELIRALFPVLLNLLDWHLRGTRYQIHVDPADGLLYSGEDGVQLTWMDAKVGDWVVTPRTGKAVEVNALWYNALCTTIEIAQHLQEDASHLEALAEQVRGSFARFWNSEQGYCFDVIDGPTGNDPALRPNQLFAVSLRYSPLAPDQQKAIVERCAQVLLTAHGLRSLAPFDSAYAGYYGGDPIQRDSSYHQGTVWAWLIGAFVEAHLRVYRDPATARTYLSAFRHHLHHHCIGTIAEIFDGAAPFTPRGAVAQAWSVAEILRVWHLLETFIKD